MMARKLGRLEPHRRADAARAERDLYERINGLFSSWVEWVWPHLNLPGDAPKGLAAERLPYNWTATEQAEFRRAVAWFIDAMAGGARDPEAYSDPSTALIDVKSPIYEGKPILPGQLRTAFSLGVNKAVQVVGDDAPALLGARNLDAQRAFLRLSFRRLSDGARVKLADVLDGETGSVRSMLLEAMNEGQNPLKTARELRKEFAKIEGYDWARLARTETSFAMNAGALGEYRERGYVDLVTANGEAMTYAPYHPNCRCGTTLLPDLGYLFPDVAATACPVCQARLAMARAILATKTRRAA